MSNGRIELTVSDDDHEVAYLSLPDHPGTVVGVVKKSVQLRNVIGPYEGPDIVLDFDQHDVLIGVEILVHRRADAKATQSLSRHDATRTELEVELEAKARRRGEPAKTAVGLTTQESEGFDEPVAPVVEHVDEHVP